MAEKHRKPEEIEADLRTAHDDFNNERLEAAEYSRKVRDLTDELSKAHKAALTEKDEKSEEEKKKAAQEAFEAHWNATAEKVARASIALAEKVFGKEYLEKNPFRKEEVIHGVLANLRTASGAADGDRVAFINFMDANAEAVNNAVAKVHKDIYDGAEFGKTDKDKGKKKEKPASREKDVNDVNDNNEPEGGGDDNPLDRGKTLSEDDQKFVSDLMGGKINLADRDYPARQTIDRAMTIADTLKPQPDGEEGDEGE